MHNKGVLFSRLILLVGHWVNRAGAFSSGAPDSVCEGDMKPRHGFAPQPGDPPVELVMDQYRMDADQYLRLVDFMLPRTAH